MTAIAPIIFAVAALLLVVFSFVLAWRLVAHKTKDPSELEAQLRAIEDDVAKELKNIKLRILTLEGSK